MDIPKNVSRPKVISSDIIELESGTTVAEMIEAVANTTFHLQDAQVEVDYSYGNSDTWKIVGYRQETEEEVKARVDEWVRVYNERMAEIEAKAEKKRAQRNDKDWKEFQRLQKKFGK